MPVLVTGGAGYIGAHVVAALEQRGERAVVVDDLSTGVAARVTGTPLHRLDLTGLDAVDGLRAILRRDRIDAVIHLAAKKRVDESVRLPIRYYRQNVDGLANLLSAMEAEQVRDVLFSSSAAVYGEVGPQPVDEAAPTVPLNPYGRSKLAGEWLVDAARTAGAVAGCSLRYFNVAGTGDPRLADLGATNLVPMVLEALLRGERPQIFGTDYDTPDGTCVRDFVHVVDLAEAHVAALDGLRAGTASARYNIGTGAGCSVRRVIDAVTRRVGSDLAAEEHPRRAGDPASVVADPRRSAEELGWRARLTMADIVASAVDARLQRRR